MAMEAKGAEYYLPNRLRNVITWRLVVEQEERVTFAYWNTQTVYKQGRLPLL